MEAGATRTRTRGETNIREAGCARARGQEYVEARLILISVHATTTPPPFLRNPLRATLRSRRRQRRQVWGGRGEGEDGETERWKWNEWNGDGE